MRLLIALVVVSIFTSGGAEGAAVRPPELAFVADGDIWLGDATGGGAVRLESPGLDYWPAWSPDGSRIAFAVADGSGSRLMVMNADGSGRRVVDQGDVQRPAWSRDGRWIAFTRMAGAETEVRIADPNGVGSSSVSAIAMLGAPDWAADGRLIVAVPTGSGSLPELRSVDPETHVSRRIDDGAWPTVSPDGRRVAYIRASATGQSLYVAGIDGSGARRVTPQRAAADRPSWSPDGRTLAFVGYHAGYQLGSRSGPYPTNFHADIYSATVDTGATRRLTGHPDEPAPPNAPDFTAPTWWPDGSRLFAFPGRIVVMNADGSCEQVSAPLEHATQVAWRPGASPGLPALRCSDLWATFLPAPTVVARNGDLSVTFTVTSVGNEPAPARVVIPTLVNAVVTRWSTASSRECSVSPACDLGTLAPEAEELVTVTFRVGSPGLFDATVRTETVDDPTPFDDEARIVAAVSECRVVGTPGADDLVGTKRRDSICGLTGADRIEGRAGDDVLDGGSGTDTILGGAGHDRVEGRGGRDVIIVRDGLRDVVACGTERDTVVADRADVVARDCERVLRS